MIDIYYSTGWKKPYCYTTIDMDMILKKPINDKDSILDGGFFHYNGKFNKEKHIELLLKSNVKFIMGFDNCPIEEKTKLTKLFLKHKKNLYPIIKTKEDWDWLIRHKFKVEGIATAVDDIINKAHKKGLKIHHLGRIRNKDNLKKITSIDINTYASPKQVLLDLGNNVVNIKKSVLKMGEFILYGSSLFVNNPGDYDILYYGPYSEEEVKAKIGNKKVNVLKYLDEHNKVGKITHLLYAVDNGILLNDCPTLMKYYNNFKSLTDKQIMNKCFIALNYFKDGNYDKELKTLIITYYYTYKNEFGKFLYDNLHLIYRIISQGDDKANMFFNRMLYRKFGLTFDLPMQNRWYMYKHKELQKAIDMFFTKVEGQYIDNESIIIKCNEAV